MSDYSPAFDEELRQDFIEEISHSLEECVEAFLNLEKAEDKTEGLEHIFRIAHSIKGGAATFGFLEMSELAHHVEDLLTILRQNHDMVSSSVVTTLLRVSDAFQQQVNYYKVGEGEPYNAKELIDELIVTVQSMGEVSTEAAPGASDEKTMPEASMARAHESIKVDTARIDRVLDAVGELVILKSQILQNDVIKNSEDQDLSRFVSQLNFCVRDLHDRAVGMRMVSLKNLFLRLQRTARDTSEILKKDVEIDISGAETEIDRTVIESLMDPLGHIVRNAIDHGIELDRSHKTEPAKMTIRAVQSGGQVIIEISDNGSGIDIERVRQKASELNYISSAEARHLEREKVFDLMFLPGFSTKDEVTNISGRGVGLDVVKANIMAVKGDISIESTEGEGTVFRISLPLSAAITDGVVVGVNGVSYIFETVFVRELVNSGDIEIVNVEQDQEVLKLRGQPIPLYRMRSMLTVPSPSDVLEADVSAVVVEHRGRRIALLVDKIYGQNQVVLKSVGGFLGQNRHLSGVSILGDGRVAFAVDLQSVIEGQREAQRSVDKAA